MVTLELIQGDHDERSFHLTRKRTVIGRHFKCDIHLLGSAISREHALITRKDNAYFLEDLNSNNGTYLNRVRLNIPAQLRDADEIQLGKVIFRFRIHGQDPAETVPTAAGKAKSELTELAAATNGETVNPSVPKTSRFRPSFDDDPHVIATLDAGSDSSNRRLDRNAQAKLKAVLDFSKTLARAVDLQEVLDRILDGLMTLFAQADEGAILLVNDSQEGIRIESAQNRHGQTDVQVPLSMTVVRRAIENEEAILIVDSADDMRFKTSESIKSMKPRSIMCVPLLEASGKTLGTIQLNTKDSLFHFTEDDLDVLVSVVAQAGLAIQNAQLHDMVAHLSEEMYHASRLSAVGELSAGIAHELHQPLAVIANYASGCQNRLEQSRTDRDQLLEGVHAIKSEALRAGEILRRVRDFVRKRELLQDLVSVNDVVEDGLRIVASNCRQFQTVITTQLADNLPNVLADRIQLTQVVVNLLLNAIESMSQADCPERRITLTTRPQDDGSIHVCVADTGPGVHPDLREKIMDQFFSTKPEGLGIGLSVSRSILNDHGGQLWVTPAAADEGGVFHFSLPIADPDQ